MVLIHYEKLVVYILIMGFMGLLVKIPVGSSCVELKTYVKLWKHSHWQDW